MIATMIIPAISIVILSGLTGWVFYLKGVRDGAIQVSDAYKQLYSGGAELDSLGYEPVLLRATDEITMVQQQAIERGHDLGRAHLAERQNRLRASIWQLLQPMLKIESDMRDGGSQLTVSFWVLRGKS